ncbi:amyloid fiber anchoring/assembly protein TapA [Virgibacillus halodenitrificans]|uniref:Amyloid fiber anchoring/assembly protein TapA n=1 Tax=Virgibacillus halodenitrificans TaxID=1482 RepID=A0AAC9NLX0_VIRHA|nr:amyloid fiber anchoring/assembly protein TapA [Virgibacillus halodenitrificans]APC49525.1 amyloid fiber anchoring/assembly protein TapA [Virgibacillus halodenitrificans]
MFNERGKKAGRKKLVIASKLVVSMYVLLFTIGYLTSNTGAYFNDKEKEEQVIQAGTWWDGSKLAFTGEQDQSGTCPGKTISVTLQNVGAKMLGSTTYKIYFAETGDPKTGEIIKSGTIAELEETGNKVLDYENVKEGTYQFSVLQREGFPDEKHQEIWSEEIVVTCEEPEAQPTEDDVKASEETSSNQVKEDEPKQADESESNQNQASYEQEELKDKKAETEAKETTKSKQTTDAQAKLQEKKATDGAQQESESKEQDQAASLADEETKKGANEDKGKEQKNEPAN